MKLIYDGVMASGRYKAKNFESVVMKGKKYDVPKDSVEELLRSGDWKRVDTIKEKPKKVKEVVSEIKEDEVSDTKDEESTYGGNKKW